MPTVFVRRYFVANGTVCDLGCEVLHDIMTFVAYSFTSCYYLNSKYQCLDMLFDVLFIRWSMLNKIPAMGLPSLASHINL